MRVDPDHLDHDHRFGEGAHDATPHDVTPGGEQLSQDARESHGIFDHLGQSAAEHAGGHVEVGHLDHDFGHDGLHDGLDGLHDSIHHSAGLGFAADHHHELHDGLHHDVHDPQHDVQHHDGLGDLFHHG